jgi:hypothetical protein
MVALILTRSGFNDMRLRVDVAHDALWVSAEVLSSAEVAELRRMGVNLTVFSHTLDPENLESDIGTVVEHHPGQVLWVETVAR